jgi:hypothetical protein
MVPITHVGHRWTPYFLNVATRKFKITCISYIIFLLYGVIVDSY